MSREKEALFKIQHFSSCRVAGLACHLPITVKLVNQHLVLIVSERFLRFGKVPHFAVPTLLHHPTDTDILGVGCCASWIAGLISKCMILIDIALFPANL